MGETEPYADARANDCDADDGPPLAACLTADTHGAGVCSVGSVSATALEKLIVSRIGMLATNEDIVERIAAKGVAEAQGKLPVLTQERIKLQAALTGSASRPHARAVDRRWLGRRPVRRRRLEGCGIAVVRLLCYCVDGARRVRPAVSFGVARCYCRRRALGESVTAATSLRGRTV
jgi:hypothetical protein